MFSFFLAALLLGFVFNAAPGAVFSETLRRGLRDGYRPALLVQIGSLVGDATWAALGLTGLALLLGSAEVRYPLTLASALYLAWLGYQSLRDAHQPPLPGGDGQGRGGSAFAAGAALSLTNPQNLVYWAAMGGAMAAIGVAEPTPTHLALFFAGFMLSSLLWCFICAGLVDWFRRAASRLWHRLTYLACGLALLGLSGMTLAELL
ncbi:LysE family transporter [Pseudomonas sp. NPDC077186]